MMQYRDFKGEQVSALGFGAMRLPVIDGDDARIDEPAAREMIEFALESGVNYFDTAWGYHGGNSQSVLGAALAAHPRDSYLLANKFPGYDVGNFGKHEQIFEEQLRRCQVDSFDFYLLHNVCELNIEQYLDDARFGTVSYFAQQAAAGRIRHLGFSAHGTLDTVRRFLDAYGEHLEFVQLQLNYMDWEFQDARAKVELARERGLAVWVMEPLRGGNLVRLDEGDLGQLEAMRPGASAVDWAMRWAADVPGVTCVLSGSSSLEQLQQNVAVFSGGEPLSSEQREALEGIGRRIAGSKGVPCTGCRYCTSHCLMQLDIPWLLSLYNEHLSRPDFAFIAPMALASLPDGKHPSDCVQCGECALVCPQQIDIPDALERFAELMGE